MSFPTTVYLTEEQILQTTSAQKMPLGTRGCLSDGRIFRYAQAGATALKAYYLCQSAAEGPASTATDQDFYSAYAAGTTYVEIFPSTIALPDLVANYYKDGYLVVNSTDTTYNQICQIDSHVAWPDSASAAKGTVGGYRGMYLKMPGLKKVVATSTALVKLVANPYKNLVVAAIAHSTGYAVGMAPCAVTATYFFWVQTWGPTLALDAEAGAATIDLSPGIPVFWSTGVAGGISAALGSTSAGVTDSGWNSMYGKVGNLVTCAPADTFFCMIDLKISP
jgi:hypothetical protein